MNICYPLSIDDQREIPPDYDGDVFVWDIDKTYLATRFSSLRGMARIPIEFAIDKTAIAGMPEVLRGLRRGPGPRFAVVPLYFVSASPPQLRGVIERKMLLDGVHHDGIIFKDWMKTLRQFRPGRLKDHVGFKLCALLAGRQSRPMAVEYLFGDDVEADAAVYSLYARILMGEPSRGDIEKTLVESGVSATDRRCVFELVDQLPPSRGSVGRIFIHLEKNTPPVRFEPFGELLVTVHGAVQLSLTLYAMGLVDAGTVDEAVRAFRAKDKKKRLSQADLLSDALERGLIDGDALVSLGFELPPRSGG